MKTSQEWGSYFSNNLKKERIDWTLPAAINSTELNIILKSLQAWQLGETSDGCNLIKAAKKYAAKINDPHYVDAVKLFIREEQKHGKNLGKYLDKIKQLRITKNWGDSFFRKIRYLNNSMEFWTLAVLTVESAAQIFYQSLKDATDCKLLKQICTDILIDEAPHIQFQMERLAIIFSHKKKTFQLPIFYCYKVFYFFTAFVVWMGHKKLFKAGGNNLIKYFSLMNNKFNKTFGKLNLIRTNKYAFGKLETSILKYD